MYGIPAKPRRCFSKPFRAARYPSVLLNVSLAPALNAFRSASTGKRNAICSGESACELAEANDACAGRSHPEQRDERVGESPPWGLPRSKAARPGAREESRARANAIKSTARKKHGKWRLGSATHQQAVNSNRRRGHCAAKFQVVCDLGNIEEHFFQVSRDRNFFDRVGKLPSRDPETRSSA
jgi:hypothetical protein